MTSDTRWLVPLIWSAAAVAALAVGLAALQLWEAGLPSWAVLDAYWLDLRSPPAVPESAGLAALFRVLGGVILLGAAWVARAQLLGRDIAPGPRRVLWLLRVLNWFPHAAHVPYYPPTWPAWLALDPVFARGTRSSRWWRGLLLIVIGLPKLVYYIHGGVPVMVERGLAFEAGGAWLLAIYSFGVLVFSGGLELMREVGRYAAARRWFAAVGVALGVLLTCWGVRAMVMPVLAGLLSVARNDELVAAYNRMADLMCLGVNLSLVAAVALWEGDNAAARLRSDPVDGILDGRRVIPVAGSGVTRP